MKIATEESFYQKSYNPRTKIYPLDLDKISSFKHEKKKRIGLIPKLEVLEPTPASIRAL